MKHNHEAECEHVLKYCRKCDEVECENCPMIWGKQKVVQAPVYTPVPQEVQAPVYTSAPVQPPSNNPFMPENPNKVFASIK